MLEKQRKRYKLLFQSVDKIQFEIFFYVFCKHDRGLHLGSILIETAFVVIKTVAFMVFFVNIIKN
tara:strand:- start:1291 stop:1485 length:195 start_codon:yes stop_codon:yes gene_type:complete